ncbi:MAG: 30S ribosomal protein S19e [Thermoplasmatota archaeon]
MVTVYDVPPNRLIDELKEELKENENIVYPEWAKFVKTGAHKEEAPMQQDWWFKRVSAILRSVYTKGPIGISKLKGKYGGRQAKGVRPKHAAKGSGSIIRESLQQLEKAGFVDKTEKGRVITSDGQSLLDDLSYDIMKDMAKDNPELSKYL